MSFVEKRSWVELLVVLLVAGWYLTDMWGRVATVPVSQIDYRPALFWNVGILVVVMVGALIATTVVGHVRLAIGKEVESRRAAASQETGAQQARANSPRVDRYAGELERSDERDRLIGRFGGGIGGGVLAVGAVVVLVLAVLEYPYFWIANAMYAALVLSTLASSGARIFAYRRGL